MEHTKHLIEKFKKLPSDTRLKYKNETFFKFPHNGYIKESNILFTGTSDEKLLQVWLELDSGKQKKVEFFRDISNVNSGLVGLNFKEGDILRVSMPFGDGITAKLYLDITYHVFESKYDSDDDVDITEYEILGPDLKIFNRGYESFVSGQAPDPKKGKLGAGPRPLKPPRRGRPQTPINLSELK